VRVEVPTIIPAPPTDYSAYVNLLCDTLNGWANRNTGSRQAVLTAIFGVCMVVLEKTRRGESSDAS